MRPKKKVSFNELVLLELEQIARKAKKSFSDVVNEAILFGLAELKKRYADSLIDKKDENVERKEKTLGEQLAEAYMRKVLFDVDNPEGWIPT